VKEGRLSFLKKETKNFYLFKCLNQIGSKDVSLAGLAIGSAIGSRTNGKAQRPSRRRQSSPVNILGGCH
jgi:hypothetical protein